MIIAISNIRTRINQHTLVNSEQGSRIVMHVYCYACNKEVDTRCIKCGNRKSKNNLPVSLCSVCGGKMICPFCGTRRFRTG